MKRIKVLCNELFSDYSNSFSDDSVHEQRTGLYPGYCKECTRFAQGFEAEKPFVQGELLVKFEPSMSEVHAKRLIAGAGGIVVRVFRKMSVYHVRVQEDNLDDAISIYKKIPGVIRVEPNYRRHARPLPR